MRKKSLFTLTVLGSLLLSACGFHGGRPLVRNGDVFAARDADDWRVLTRRADVERTIDLVSSGETFLLLISKSGCPACSSLKDDLIPYLEETRQLLLLIEDDFPTYEEMVERKPDVFPAPPAEGLELPALYLVEGEKPARKFQRSLISSERTLRSTMEKNFYLTNVYSYTMIDALKARLADEPEMNVLFLDRSDALARRIYLDQVRDLGYQAKEEFAIFELDGAAEADRTCLLNEWGVPAGARAFFINFHDGRPNATKELDENNVEGGIAFLKDYL